MQRRLWRLITGPEGVQAALAAEGDASGAALATLLRGDRGLAPGERVAVYANAYFVRIHDCLRDDFGALARALGPDAFHDLVKTYLMAHPPTRPSLRHAGARLAEHLDTAPFASIFGRRCAYAADLARLEWAVLEAFDAADAPVLERETLAAVPHDAWGELRFEATPSLSLLGLAWPVHAVRERYDGDEDDAVWAGPPVLGPESTHIRVWRNEERVRYRAISALEADALAAVQRGEPFGALCERIAGSVGDAEAAPCAAAFLEAWLAAGLLVRLAGGLSDRSDAPPRR